VRRVFRLSRPVAVIFTIPLSCRSGPAVRTYCSAATAGVGAALTKGSRVGKGTKVAERLVKMLTSKRWAGAAKLCGRMDLEKVSVSDNNNAMMVKMSNQRYS
jgi:hypothetical protein